MQHVKRMVSQVLTNILPLKVEFFFAPDSECVPALLHY